MRLIEGQMSNHKGAGLMLDALPGAKAMLADKDYDGDWFRQVLGALRTVDCIPSKVNRHVHIPHDPILYRQRHHIENMFGKPKD